MKIRLLPDPGRADRRDPDHVNVYECSGFDDRRSSHEDLANATMLGKTLRARCGRLPFQRQRHRRAATRRHRAHCRPWRVHQAARAPVCRRGHRPARRAQPARDRHSTLVPEAVRIIRDAWPEAKIGCIYYNDRRFPAPPPVRRAGLRRLPGRLRHLPEAALVRAHQAVFGGFVRRGSYLRFAELLRRISARG